MYVYLQQIVNLDGQFVVVLQTDHRDIYSFFLNNLHVVRHTDRLRASLSTYLVIEQTLMRNINSTGGLSRDIATDTALCKISPASLITLASNT